MIGGFWRAVWLGLFPYLKNAHSLCSSYSIDNNLPQVVILNAMVPIKKFTEMFATAKNGNRINIRGMIKQTIGE